MRKILAVSGGIDSMILLHIFRNDPTVLVAHFNHGTRPSADSDEAFVEKTAKSYGLEFVSSRANLGENASEEAARYIRYEFFSKLCADRSGELYTAHHARDLIETIAINLLRGTGWRGLAPFGNSAVKRPFLDPTLLPPVANRELSADSAKNLPIDKPAIYRYATTHNLTFREDPTNSDDAYLRNRLRPKVKNLENSASETILNLYHDTHNLKLEIDTLSAEILDLLAETPKNPEPAETHKVSETSETSISYPRAPFKTLDDKAAEELLRVALKRANISATRPQIRDFLAAIHTYSPGKYFNLPKSRLVKLSKTSFSLYSADIFPKNP